MKKVFLRRQYQNLIGIETGEMPVVCAWREVSARSNQNPIGIESEVSANSNTFFPNQNPTGVGATGIEAKDRVAQRYRMGPPG